MEIVFLGPPGSGKGTQAGAVVDLLGVPEISTGDLIRETVRGQSKLAAELRSFVDKGKLVPDDLVNQMVEQRLDQDDCISGFLLDGYPRTLEQAKTLDSMLAARGRRLRRVLFLDVDDKTLLERVVGRRSDPETGRIYHVVFDPPPPELESRLIHRSDDCAEVFSARLAEYREKTVPLIKYYEERGLLAVISGIGGVDDIAVRIKASLKLGRNLALQAT